MPVGTEVATACQRSWQQRFWMPIITRLIAVTQEMLFAFPIIANTVRCPCSDHFTLACLHDVCTVANTKKLIFDMLHTL